MVGSLIDLPTPNTREEWVAQIRLLEDMRREHPDDDGIRLGIQYAERVIAETDALAGKAFGVE